MKPLTRNLLRDLSNLHVEFVAPILEKLAHKRENLTGLRCWSVYGVFSLFPLHWRGFSELRGLEIFSFESKLREVGRLTAHLEIGGVPELLRVRGFTRTYREAGEKRLAEPLDRWRDREDVWATAE